MKLGEDCAWRAGFPPYLRSRLASWSPPARRDECSPQAGSGARTTEALYEAMGEALKQVCSQDALGWFQSCGLRATQE